MCYVRVTQFEVMNRTESAVLNMEHKRTVFRELNSRPRNCSSVTDCLQLVVPTFNGICSSSQARASVLETLDSRDGDQLTCTSQNRARWFSGKKITVTAFMKKYLLHP